MIPARRLKGTSVDVSIVTSGHNVADARLHRISAALVRAGLSVEVLGHGLVKDAPEGVSARVHPRPGLKGRALLALVLPWRAKGGTLLVLDPDALLGARLATAARHRHLVADIHEDYDALVHDRAWALRVGGVAGRGARVMVRLATAVARGCDLTIVADDHVPPLRAANRLVIRNEPDPRLLSPEAGPDESPRAVYVGDVRGTRGLTAMLEAVEGAPGWKLDVVGPVAVDDRPWLAQRLADSPDLAARIHWYGRLTPRRSWEVATGAWAGLCLLEPTSAFVDAVPSKLYEYLAAGIVPVVTDLPRQSDLVREADSGVVVADGSSAAAALMKLQSDPQERLRASAAGRAWAGKILGNGAGYDLLAAAVCQVSRG